MHLNARFNMPIWIALIGGIGICLTGCNPPPSPTLTASGTVVVRGKPLSGAVITLEPMRETKGPNASVPIFDGRFEVPADAGLHGGMYRVRIAMIPAEIRKAIPADQAKSMPPDDAMIDPAFDASSQLTCELKPDHANALAFAVEFLSSDQNHSPNQTHSSSL
ncbi:hypothetical protein Poly51_27280 [Rubripirellula tenax]|uniref:Carboxypeptidase regulatory-like domain-containing protein n=1 Tax=Rubripirellula tenax TaxID=2528015 RepID=A0A5C6FB44_9BACT|nr:hypothetical protein [Rubripirellula tenax]TWU56811.1 hypothetical protein Poly51_27280 [Rubripirellula tenax]